MTGRARLCAHCRKQPVQRAATGRPRRYCSDACRVAAWRKRNRRLRTTREVFGSSRSDDWATPRDVFADLAARHGPFDLDVCASATNAKCERYFTREDDGLAQEWRGVCWMNPPYGRMLAAWMAKAWEASQSTADLVVCLVPARTDTRWWHEFAVRGEVEFLRGRLKFGDSENSAPYPSAVVVFRNTVARNETARLRAAA